MFCRWQIRRIFFFFVIFQFNLTLELNSSCPYSRIRALLISYLFRYIKQKHYDAAQVYAPETQYSLWVSRLRQYRYNSMLVYSRKQNAELINDQAENKLCLSGLNEGQDESNV